MNKKEWKELAESKVIFLDGATGSNLYKKGMPAGVCPEKWILENPEKLIELQMEFIEAGTDILYAPTFTGNRIKLKEYGLENDIQHMNHVLVGLSKEAVKRAKEKYPERKIWVAGDLTMTGEQVYPIGKMLVEELIDVYKEQVKYLLEADVDLFVVETMMSLQETRAAVIAIKECCDLPIMATLTFNDDCKTLFGTDPATAVVVLENLGVSAVGLNCSTGPDKMLTVVEEMKRVATIPIIAKPNAGLPHLEDGETVFDMQPEEFAKHMEELVEAGAAIVGGCCGSTPEHIKALTKKIGSRKPVPCNTEKVRALSTERKTLQFDLDGRFMVVGERINPTGKKALQAELREGNLDMVLQFAQEQKDNGASILDVNVGMNGIDEKEMMLKVVNELTLASDLPLCIDSSHIPVIEAALRIYPGRALVNSVSLEKEKFEKLIPIVKKYGAMFILLPLSDEGLPKDLDEKKEIIQIILQEAKRQGFTEKDIVVDGLVNTIGANKMAAWETMETIRHCKHDLGIATICGLSNISFGLPERIFVNSTFLALAIREGLTMAIANPSQNLLMNVAFATDLLMNKEEADVNYIKRVTQNPMTIVTETKDAAKEVEGSQNFDKVAEAVIKGRRKQVVDLVKEALEAGQDPQHMIETMLIPAINEVGRLFDKQIYFLPQLISSAETMKIAIDYLEPMLKKENETKLGTVIMATVAGDIHDIGKNLVVLMLKNYGFEVIDLGKDVPTELIIETAKEKNADIIGLSALMTTTMTEMKTVIERAKEEKLTARIIIGGAVITQDYADEIGADGYSRDAQEAVKLVKRLLDLN
ncbi:homocysteine S-methyltransferase family protein [[Clostridium] polysaccharolyticum]|uniref:Methionine synthase n=1 Tax=[Clostridium] polysaccharolyticum TaxID=29364 RepID=A0A1I0D1W5_9FIRM|nr:homocysteine S-methyltransferase family protein [[Clostridium] polysaccharolyticum]SET26135.1 5-methyltetrahydrofolate--homocysteine methyltransferase [[Clostridium] polysaccharolyticum]